MTRLSLPSPAGKEWLTTPTIVKYTTPFWVMTGSCEPTVHPVAAASPAGTRKLGPSSSDMSAVVLSPETTSSPPNESYVAGSIAATPSDAPATLSDRKLSGVALATPVLPAIAASTWSSWVTGLLTSTLPAKRCETQLSLAVSAPALSALTPTAVATAMARPAVVMAVRLRARTR